MKFHLNNSRTKKSDRENFLQYYDQFPFLFRFASIIQSVFMNKFKRNIGKKNDSFEKIDVFEYFNDEVNIDDANNEQKQNDKKNIIDVNSEQKQNEKKISIK